MSEIAAASSRAQQVDADAYPALLLKKAVAKVYTQQSEQSRAAAVISAATLSAKLLCCAVGAPNAACSLV